MHQDEQIINIIFGYLRNNKSTLHIWRIRLAAGKSIKTEHISGNIGTTLN